MFQVSFIFSKTGWMRYISHLDLMRLFSRALRRANIPVKLSQGFSPHLKLSITRALKLGIESESEEAKVTLKELINLEEFKNKLQLELPEGITIKEVKLNYGKRNFN